jgi:hypothetical protein
MSEKEFDAVKMMHEIKNKLNKEFEADLGFSRRLGIGFDIIGRKDPFERFVICFDERNRRVETK